MKIVLFDGDHAGHDSQFRKAVSVALGEVALVHADESELVTNEAVISEVESHPEDYSRLRISEIPDGITDLGLITGEEWVDWEEIDMERTCTVVYVVDGKIHYLV